MKIHSLKAISVAVFSISFMACSIAQMSSKSQGTGAPVLTPGRSASANLNGASQALLSLDLSGINIGGSGAITLPDPQGGSGAGLVSYVSNTPNVCSVNGNLLTPLTPGDCTIVATKAGSGVYGSTTAQATKRINALTQTALTFNLGSLNLLDGPVAFPSASGGSGTLDVIYTATGACSKVGANLRADSVGTCTITATNPANGLYSAATVSSDIVIQNREQQALVVTMPATWTNNVGTASVSGGSGGGSISWSSSDTAVCSVASPVNGSNSSATVTRKTFGTCSITATKSADTTNFYNAASVSNNLSISVNSFATSCWVAGQNGSCGSGRIASKEFVESSLCSNVSITSGISGVSMANSIYLKTSDGQYTKGGLYGNISISVSNYLSGASWGSSGAAPAGYIVETNTVRLACVQ